MNLNFNKKLLIILLTFFICKNGFADLGSYNKVALLQFESKGLKVLHYHDFSYRRHYETENYYYYGANSIFNDSLNTYSFLQISDSITNKVLFKKPCPPLSKIIISDNGKYIIGLSNIKYNNPYQLVIFNTKGDLLLKKSIESLNIKLNSSQLKDLINNYPEQTISQIENNFVSKSGDNYYLYPYTTFNMRDTVYKKYIKSIGLSFENPVFPDIGGSITNYVYWYNEDSPIKSISEDSINNLISITINDIENVARTLNLNDESLNIDYFLDKNLISDKKIMAYRKSISNYNIDRPDYKSIYLQIGNIYEYYATVDELVKQDSLSVITKGLKDSLSFRFVSCNICAYTKDSLGFDYNLEGAVIADELKSKIKDFGNIKGEKLILFSEIRIYDTISKRYNYLGSFRIRIKD